MLSSDKDVALLPEFIVAIQEKDIKKIKLLLEQGFDINKEYVAPDLRNVSITALHYAARFGPLDFVKFLLDNGANPNLTTNGKEPYNNITPLYLASAAGNTEIVKLLLEKGADINLGQNPNEVAKENKQREILLILSTKEKDKSKKYKDPVLMAPFVKQVIIDFTSNENDQTEFLRRKWDEQHPYSPCIIINGWDFLKNPRQFTLDETQGPIRIYINAHSTAGSDAIFSRNVHSNDSKKTKSIKYQPLAKSLALYISNQNVVINLHACAAGKGTMDHSDDNSFNSFASKLHITLVDRMHRDIPVSARMHLTTHKGTEQQTMNLDYSIDEAAGLLFNKPFQYGIKSMFSAFFSLHRQPGSKVIFILDSEGNQIRLDKYEFLWKKRVFEKLVFSLNKERGTSIEEKKALLKRWFNDFQQLTNNEIVNTLKKELENSDTVLKKHSSPISSLFKNPTTYNAILELIKERERILSSKYTKKEPVLTGRKIK